MARYSDLSRDYKNLVLLDIIINTHRSNCDLSNADSVKAARERAAIHIAAIVEKAMSLRNYARMMGINPENPEEYIAQLILEERLKINSQPSHDQTDVKYATAH